MKKLLMSLILVLILLPTIFAIDLSIEKKSSNDVIIKGLDQPATFNLEIHNKENGQQFEFFNLLGFIMEPKQKVFISSNGTEEIELIVYPREGLNVKNFYTLQYFIRDASGDELKEKVTMKFVELQDAFEIGTGEIDPQSESIELYIHNKEKFNFEDLNVKFSSKFFEMEETIDLNANKRKNFTIPIDKEDFKELTAGFYTLTADVSVQNISGEVEGIIKFVEKNLVESSETEYGWVVSTQVIEKTNNGNTIQTTETSVTKSILSRLFTSFSPEPNIVERKGTSVHYTWNSEIKPGETIEIRVKTNWLFPLLVIVLVLFILFLVKKGTSTDVVLRKRVSFVKAKGGEFALKVTLTATAKNYVERIKVTDRLPGLMKIYERFGGDKPSKVDERLRRIEWDFEKLEAGEMRTISYIIYSKSVGVMGRFALPSAFAIYQKDGSIKEAESNRAFFVAEQRTKDLGEE